MTLSITKLCHYAEWHCAERQDLFIGMLNVVILSVVAPFLLSGTPMADIPLVKFKSKKT